MQEEAYRVGDWLFLSGQGLLRSEAGDVEVMLTPRAAQLLACLVGRAGEVLGRDELIDGAWARAEVTDHALTQAVFELRQALRGERDDAPCYIQTVPKRGYRLAVPVERCAKPLPAAGLPDAVRTGAEPSVATSLDVRPRLWRGPVVAAALVLVALSFAAFFLWHRPFPATAAQDSLPNSRRIAVHIGPTGDERLAALQYGLGSFAAHILSVQTPYEVVQFVQPGNDAACCQNSARVLRLGIERVGEADFLRARFTHRLRAQRLFDKRYPLQDLPGAMSALAADLLQALHYPRPAEPLAAPPALDPHNSERFFQAYYQVAKGDAASLRTAHATLAQMTATPAPRTELLALRGSVELVLSNLDAGEGARWLAAADATFAALHRQQDSPYFAYPVVLEARAMHALYRGRQAEGEALIEHSLQQSETWRAQIVRGKLAELAGRLDEAADAYSRAYLLKPDPGTLAWIARVGYDTDLAEVAPLLAEWGAGTAGGQASPVEG